MLPGRHFGGGWSAGARTLPAALPVVVLIVLLMTVPTAAGASTAGVRASPEAGGASSPVVRTVSGYAEWVLVFDAQNQEMYAAAEGHSPANVSAFSGTDYRFLTGIAAGKNVMGYFVSPLGLDTAQERLYVQESARSGTGELGVISTRADGDVTAHKYLDGCGAAGPTYDPLNGLLYLNCGGVGPNRTLELAAVNPATLAIEALIPYSFPPYPGTASGFGPAVDLRTGNLYVLHNHYSGGTVTVINPTTHRVVANITVPRSVFGPGPIYDAANGLIYQPGTFGNISVINPAMESVVRTFVVPGIPSLAFLPRHNEFAVLDDDASGSSGAIWYLNATTGRILGHETVPSSTVGIAYDSVTDTVWATDPYNGGTLEILRPIV